MKIRQAWKKRSNTKKAAAKSSAKGSGSKAPAA
jgi:hypothetical protein